MQPLLVLAALLVARVQILSAAPQPLSLMDATTNSDDSSTTEALSNVDSELTILEEKFINESASTADLPPDVTTDVEDTSKTKLDESFSTDTNTVLESLSGEVKDFDISSTTSDGVSTFSDSVTKTDITESSSSSTDSVTKLSSQGTPSTEASNLELTEKDDEKAKTPQISRYVPPLDPMKHMLMMAEAKKLHVSSTETNLETIATDGSLVKDQSATEKTITDSNESDKEAAESSEVQNLELTTADSITTILNKNTDAVPYVDPVESKENVSDRETSTEIVHKSTTSIPTTLLDSETTPVYESNDNSSDIIHESSVLIKSSELFSGKGDDSSISEGTRDVFESTTPQGSSESIITFSSTSVPIDTDSPNVTFPITTLGEIQKDESNNVPSLVHSEDLVVSEDQGSEHDSIPTTSEAETTDEIKRSSTESISVSLEEILLTSTSPTAEIDSEAEKGLEKLSSQSESVKNLSLEDILAFREAGLSLNFSEAVNSDTTNVTVDVPEEATDAVHFEITENTNTQSDSETVTSGIFTTIKELIFPSTTTKPLLKTTNESELESVSKDESEIVPESSTLDSLKGESESISKEESPELVKVELLKSDINSLSTNSEEGSTSAGVEFETKPSLVDNDQNLDTISVENISKPLTDELKVNKESLEIADDKSHTTVFSVTSEDSSISSESELSETVAVTESSKSQDVTDSGTIEKYSSNNESPKDRYVSGNNSDTVAAVQFLHYHDKSSSEQCYKLVNAHWNYATNLTDENKKKQLEQTLEYALFHKEAWKNATSFAWKSFNDTLLRRWFKSLSVLGTAALPEDKLNEFNRLKAEMKNVYSTSKVCPYASVKDKKERSIQNSGDCSLTLEPDLTRILTKSRDYDELTYVWKVWRDVAGKPIREKYLRFVNLSNEAARLNGFSDNGDMWRESYESTTFETDLEMLWDQLRPLYEHLHAYVRRRLIQQYGNDKIKDDGPIPAHLFGNMWAQSWVSLMDIAQPFPGKPSVDVTPIMEAKNMTALEMFKISEEFFTSLGLKEMPEEFWKHSLIEKPKDREIICHASAWDFCNGKDYRIKQCTDITMEDLITVHHEMGHIQYFLQYARQPNVFREGANPGFHEAIGDVLALSVSTPKHLKSIGLLEEVSDDPEGDLNFLLFTALDKVSFLPSGYLIDLWRWGLFSGDIKPEEMNSKWWDLRLKYQGICPPVKRHDTDFDPGAKFHVPGNVPYIRYFVSFVIQFQFHKVLCDAAGHMGPLYKCDIYRSKEAGQILSQVMELGSSEHWSEAMKIMTGGATNRMDAGPILEYFQPLLAFLEEQNQNETLGWRSEDSTICP